MTATRPLALAGAVAALSIAVTAAAAFATFGAAEPGAWRAALTALAAALPVLALFTLRPLAVGVGSARRSSHFTGVGDLPEARKFRHRARHAAWVVMGSCLPLLLASAFVLFLLANDHAVQRTFFNGEFVSRSAGDVTRAFGQNLFIAVAAEVLVLVWGLVVAIARLAPGPAGRPLRWLATAYVDMFRAIPSIIVIYLVGFGLPLADVPLLSDLSPTWAAVLALTLTYGAYVAEVYRAGIESIHWSPGLRRPLAGAVLRQDHAVRGRPAGGAPGHAAAAQRLHRPAEGHRPGDRHRRPSTRSRRRRPTPATTSTCPR